jgi:hypothetical protein
MGNVRRPFFVTNFVTKFSRLICGRPLADALSNPERREVPIMRPRHNAPTRKNDSQQVT